MGQEKKYQSKREQQDIFRSVDGTHLQKQDVLTIRQYQSQKYMTKFG